MAPVSQTNEESDLGGGGRFDRNVCRAAESDCDGGIYVELCTRCGIRILFQIQYVFCSKAFIDVTKRTKPHKSYRKDVTLSLK